MANLTLNELLNTYSYCALNLQRLLQQDRSGFQELIDAFPFPIIVSRTGSIQIVQMNKAHQRLSHYPQELIMEDCESYLESFVQPASLERARRVFPYFYREAPSNSTLRFLQYVQATPGGEYSPLMTFVKAPERGTTEVVRLGIEPRDFGRMVAKVGRVVELDEYMLAAFSKYRMLGRRELEVVKSLAMARSGREIAEQLSVSERAVDAHWRNIKRKLEINSYQDLLRFALAFDLFDTDEA